MRGDDYPAGEDQRLLYCLQPSQNGERMPVLTVSLISARVNKGGDFGRNYSQPSLGDFLPERAPKYYRDIDIGILTELANRPREYGHYPGQRLQSAELLQQIIATGRAFWLDHEPPPLRWGEKREGPYRMAPGGKKAVVPQLIVPGMTAFNAEPPVYVDEAAGVMGPVELNLPPRLAYQICQHRLFRVPRSLRLRAASVRKFRKFTMAYCPRRRRRPSRSRKHRSR